MRKRIVAGNWKMNKSLSEGIELAKEINNALKTKKTSCQVILGTPFIHLADICRLVDKNNINISAQNCSDKESGAFTGEVSANMIQSTGATHVILGHSERRRYYGENNAVLKEKVTLALKNGLIPIFCIGETLSEREVGKHFEIIKTQLEEALFSFPATDFSKLILAYEPVWAIGTGKTATAEQAQEIHQFIRQSVTKKYNDEVAQNISILYGGSCNANNAGTLFAQADIDGGLIGGASLKSTDFLTIINSF